MSFKSALAKQIVLNLFMCRGGFYERSEFAKYCNITEKDKVIKIY